ncbi:PucR family transcriptional regulator [Alteribacillus sp. HJP-4]|uniref:PucR family transcriptional regulator n=1 Tax=Alteribacillus sp. HJP-4 TaxID=2775394 RepID=UPI0035CCFE0E
MKDVIELEVMKDSKLLTTAVSSMERAVEWVSIIETPVENFVRKNEIVLTTGIGCGNDEQKLLTFIKEVMDADAAALVIALGRHVISLPDKVIEMCEKQGFPLIELPWDIRFSDVSHAISSALNKKEMHIVERSDKIRKELLKIIMEGQGLQEIVSYLSSSLEMPVIVSDRRGVLKAKSKRSEKLEEKWNAYLYRFGDPLPQRQEELLDSVNMPNNMDWIGLDADEILQLSVQSAREILGFILIEWPEQSLKDDLFQEENLILLEHTVTTSALCFLHDQAALETEMRLRDDFVWSLAKGKLESKDTALSRAKSLGYHLNVPYLCLIAKPENLEYLYNQDPGMQLSYENWLRSVGDLLEEEVYHCGRTLQIKTMSTFQKDALIMYIELISSNSIETAFPFIELLQYRLEQKLQHLTLSWGVAKSFGEDTFHVGFQEAYSALDVGQKQKGPGFISTYADTRFDRALLALTENEELRQTTDLTIAPLFKYSKERGIDLIHTFIIYNKHKGNVSQTARALNLHRQSLLYRLKKIEALTGCDLDNPDDTFLLDLSVRLHTLSGVKETKDTPKNM